MGGTFVSLCVWFLQNTQTVWEQIEGTCVIRVRTHTHRRKCSQIECVWLLFMFIFYFNCHCVRVFGRTIEWIRCSSVCFMQIAGYGDANGLVEEEITHDASMLNWKLIDKIFRDFRIRYWSILYAIRIVRIWPDELFFYLLFFFLVNFKIKSGQTTTNRTKKKQQKHIIDFFFAFFSFFFYAFRFFFCFCFKLN